MDWSILRRAHGALRESPTCMREYVHVGNGRMGLLLIFLRQVVHYNSGDYRIAVSVAWVSKVCASSGGFTTGVGEKKGCREERAAYMACCYISQCIAAMQRCDAERHIDICFYYFKL